VQRRRLREDQPVFGIPRLRPMLASVAEAPFDDDAWIFEVKWDGYRCLAYISGDEVYLDSRNGKPLLPQFPGLKDIPRAIGAHSALLDGEIVAIREGRVDFSYLRTGPPSVTFVTFDILSVDGRHLWDCPLVERKSELARVVRPAGPVVVSEVVDGRGKALFEWAKGQDLEGIIAKRKDSVYLPGERTDDWLKVRNVREGSFWVLGYASSPGRVVGSLVVAERRDDGFLLVGRVSSGLNREYEREILEALEPLAFEELVSRCGTLYDAPSRRETQKIRWVKPYFGVQVSYTEMTRERKLRHPVFRGLVAGEQDAG
jgi:DNA ligase D-like protein (predicted ligase)